MKNMMKKENGFTLIELIIVIAILAIIAAVAIPNILGAVDNSRRSTDVANAKIIANAAAQVLAKKEDAAGATWDDTAALNVTDLTSAGTGATANLEFSKQLFLELNSAMPTPKFKGGTVTEDEFYLVLNSTTGTVQVYIGNNAAVGVAANASQVYPTPIADYTQK